MKLSRELSKRSTGRTLYILDEPTTGLHFEDIRKLLRVLDRLVEAGNTVVVIEHNLDVIKTADWVVDVGPDGGDGGGRVVAAGTPEQVAAVSESYTGRFLADMLPKPQAPPRGSLGGPLEPPQPEVFTEQAAREGDHAQERIALANLDRRSLAPHVEDGGRRVEHVGGHDTAHHVVAVAVSALDAGTTSPGVSAAKAQGLTKKCGSPGGWGVKYFVR